MLYLVPLAVLFGLLLIAAIEDLRVRRIPNWLNAAVVALYPAHLLTSPLPVPWLPALGLAIALFAAGAALFAWRLLGGGDVKLIAALGLWSGPEHVAAFAFATAISGGALALFYLWYERRGWPLFVPLLAALPPRRAAEGVPSAAATVPAGVPYGVAIATGGLVVLHRLLGL